MELENVVGTNWVRVSCANGRGHACVARGHGGHTDEGVRMEGLQVHTFADLTSPFWEKYCPGVHADKREYHLSDEEFGANFKMTKAEYKAR